MTHNYVWQPWQYTIHSSTDSPSENLVKTNRRTERTLLTMMEYAANLERSPEEQFADTIFYTSIMAVGLILTHLGVIKLIQKYTGTSFCSHSYHQLVHSYQCPAAYRSLCAHLHSQPGHSHLSRAAHSVTRVSLTVSFIHFDIRHLFLFSLIHSLTLLRYNALAFFESSHSCCCTLTAAYLVF